MSLLGGVVTFLLVTGAYWMYDSWRSAERDESGAVTTAGLMEMDGLRTGDCFDDNAWLAELATATAAGNEVGSVSVKPCADAHDFEIFHVADLPFDEDAPFPGDEILAQRSDSDICFPAFEPFVGQVYEDSELDYVYLMPTEESWSSGDRETLCALFAMDGSQIIESAKGSGR
jgi:hypothetical protein